MREIKFRGKVRTEGVPILGPCPIEDGEWIYGDLHIRCKYPHIHYGSGLKAPIDLDTIGQYTGLKDANGKEIYEGDLVKSSFSNRVFGMVAWNTRGYFYIMESFFINEDYEEQDRRPLGEMLRLSIENKPCNFTVIGNIHDNPELIEK